jgi:aspartate aminotransferase
VPVSNNVNKRMTEGSWIRRMFDEGTELKKRYGEKLIFDLSLGNPVMEPPPEFDKELKKLVKKPIRGMHRYMENAGYAETRAAVAVQMSHETGIKFCGNDIVMTCGAAGGLNVVLKTILNPGDEVIVFAPYFMEFGNYIDNHGGVIRVLPTDDKFIPRLDALEAAISNKTRAVIINSPNNPTGVVYSRSLISKLGEILLRKEAQYGSHTYLISDEAYRKIIYDKIPYPPVFHHHHHSVVVHSHSKDLALAGERIGFIAIHPDCPHHDELVNGFIFCNRILGFVNAPALMQHLVKNLQHVTVSIAEYQRKRDFLYDNLKGMGYSVVKPQGAFYMFPRSPIDDDVAFVNQLREYNVLVVPGRGFGTPGYFRISYCVDDETLKGAMEGFKVAAEKYGLR